MINLYARNRGWRLEEVKREIADRAEKRGIVLKVSDRPLPAADAWIAVRTGEAGRSPDPARTVVAIHDLLGPETYALGGSRDAVARAGALHLSHRAQRDILEKAGAVEASRILPCLSPGVDAPARPRAGGADFTVAWFGRPEIHAGRERHRPDLFAAALCTLGPRCRVLLAGEKLAPISAMLRAAGIAVREVPTSEVPLSGWRNLVADVDVLVATGDFDPAPRPVFEALAVGVPVVSRPVGWATDLIRDGETGFLAEHPAEIAAALERMIDARQGWRDRAAAIRAAVAPFPRSSWIDQGLDAALALAGATALREAV